MAFVEATRSLGRAGLFCLSVLRASTPTADFFVELVREIYKIGARSLPIIAGGESRKRQPQAMRWPTSPTTCWESFRHST